MWVRQAQDGPLEHMSTVPESTAEHRRLSPIWTPRSVAGLFICHWRCNVGLFSFPRWPYCTFLKSITSDHPHSFTSTICTSCLLVLIVSIFCMLHPDLHFPCGSAGKESACNAGDLGSIPGLGRPPGEGKGYPLQYSGLENSKDCIVHGVAKSQTSLSDLHLTSPHQL